MITLGTVQNSTIINVSGFCPTSPQFIQTLNEVIERYMNRGDWHGSVVPVRVCVRQGCVTWPRYVDEVRKIMACRGAPVTVKSVWYEFLEWSGNHRRYGWDAWRGDERHMTAQLRVPCYNDIYGPNCTVRFYAQTSADIGKVIWIYGTDNNNQPLRNNNQDGTWSDGIPVTLALPFGSTSNPYFVSRVERVVKPITQGNITMYAYDTVQNVLWDLAVYEPSEQNPSYIRYKLDPRFYSNQACQGTCQETIIALVKLKYVPVSAPNDPIFISNIGALKFGMMAFKREEANDFTGASGLWQQGITELNRELENASPDSQLPVTQQVIGRRRYRNHAF